MKIKDREEPNQTVLLIILFLLIFGFSWYIFLIIPPLSPKNTGSLAQIDFNDNFSAGFVNSALWKITHEGDVRKSVVDVVPYNTGNTGDYRLRLGLDTIGTRDETVKYIGIRSIKQMDLSGKNEISFDINWNNQSNGCYLTTAIFLCPTITDTNPGREKDWVKFEYVGVPPGQNARAVFARSENGNIEYLYTEGWPEQRIGRRIDYQRIKIVLDNNSLTIIENGKLLYNTDSRVLKSNLTYLYFQLSSHSNYPFREVYFDNISVI